jgi:hypothetical protein
VVLLALSLAVTTVTSATWTAREQSSETVPIYFYLNFPDRSTREYWQGERIDLPTLQLWSRGLAAAIVDGSTMLRPVVTREEAKVVIEIRRCQVAGEAEFVIGGIMMTETISEPFLMVTPYWPTTLKATIHIFENDIQHITEFAR